HAHGHLCLSELGLNPVQQDITEFGLDPSVEVVGGPAAFVLWLLDQGDLGHGLDQLETGGDHVALLLRELGRDLGRWYGSMSLEPGGLELTPSDLAGKRDLEGTVSEWNLGRALGWATTTRAVRD